MSRFDAIDLSALPPPDVIENLDYEDILAEMKAAVVEAFPAIEPVLKLEGEPAAKVLQVCAYYVMLTRARVNDAGRAVMLAFATGADLDHLGALLGVERLVVEEGDPEAVPPVPDTLEGDDPFRSRIKLAVQGFSTAGPVGAYQFWGLSADGAVKDIYVESPDPGDVVVTVLSHDGDGTADTALRDKVAAMLTGEDVRPLTDHVTVQSATIIPYAVEATLHLFDGPDAEVVEVAAQAAVEAYVEDTHRLGRDVTISGLHAALHQSGVARVELTAPAETIAVEPDEAAHCTDITIAVAGA